jgi:hypothetical protein
MSRKDIAEVIGVVAVVASLLFLAYQIRQSNQIARSTITYELANNSSEIYEIIWSNPEVSALHVKITDPAYEPTGQEQEMLRAEARRFMNLWGAVEIAYRNGHQSREQFEILLDDVEATLRRSPAAHEVWARELNSFPGLASFEFHARAMEVIGE